YALRVPGDLLAGPDLRHVRDGREREGEPRGAGEQVDSVGQEAGHRPRVVALRGHRPGGYRGAHCVASPAGASLASGGVSSSPGPRNGAWGCVAPEARPLALCGVWPGGCGPALPVADRGSLT